MNYTLTNLQPSDVRWIEDHIILENHRHDLFQRLYRMLSHDTDNIAMLDVIYCSGVQLSRAFKQLTHTEQEEIRAINNMASRCFLDGVGGLAFSPK